MKRTQLLDGSLFRRCSLWGRQALCLDGAKESHEVRRHKGPSWQETNVPTGQPAATTGHVWGSFQVIQLLGFKLPWHQLEQMGAVHIVPWANCRFMGQAIFVFFKPLSPLATGISPLQHHFHTIMSIPHCGSCLYSLIMMVYLLYMKQGISSPIFLTFLLKKGSQYTITLVM